MSHQPIRSVNFRDDVLFGMAHLLGIDPTLDLLNDHARAWVSFINRHVRSAYYFWDWPEANLTEERAFRQVYRSTSQYLLEAEIGGDPDEVYYLDTELYYRVTGASNPPVGTLPTDDDFFTAIEPFDRYIAYDQPGKQSIGKVISVAATDPRTLTPAANWGFRPDEKGIYLGSASGPTVWVTYQPREPVFTVTPWSATAAYVRHELAYDVASGKCYRCLIGNTGESLLSTAWLEQVMLYTIAEHVKLASAADAADDVILKADLAMQARKALEDEVDRLVEQGEKYFYTPARAARQPLGLSGFYWSVAAPTP